MKLKLLVVDRESLLRDSLVKRLTGAQHRVFCAANPTEIASMLRHQRFDVALLNLVDLGTTGLDWLKQIKRIRPYLEVLLINQSDQIHLSIEGMKLGARDDLMLPIDTRQLLTSIDAAVKQRKGKGAGRKGLGHRMEEIMIAVSFAEAGELETARRYLNRPDPIPEVSTAAKEGYTDTQSNVTKRGPARISKLQKNRSDNRRRNQHPEKPILLKTTLEKQP